MATYFNGKEVGSSMFFTANGEYFGESQADWNETDPTSLAYIKNKPNLSSGYVISLTSSQAVLGVDISSFVEEITRDELAQIVASNNVVLIIDSTVYNLVSYDVSTTYVSMNFGSRSGRIAIAYGFGGSGISYVYITGKYPNGMQTILERTAGNGVTEFTHNFGQYDLVLMLSRPKSTSEYIPTVLPLSIASYYVSLGKTFTFQVADDGAYSKWGFGTNKIWYDSGNSGDIIGLYGIKF